MQVVLWRDEKCERVNSYRLDGRELHVYVRACQGAAMVRDSFPITFDSRDGSQSGPRRGRILLTRVDGETWRSEPCAPGGLATLVLVLRDFPDD